MGPENLKNLPPHAKNIVDDMFKIDDVLSKIINNIYSKDLPALFKTLVYASDKAATDLQTVKNNPFIITDIIQNALPATGNLGKAVNFFGDIKKTIMPKLADKDYYNKLSPESKDVLDNIMKIGSLMHAVTSGAGAGAGAAGAPGVGTVASKLLKVLFFIDIAKGITGNLKNAVDEAGQLKTQGSAYAQDMAFIFTKTVLCFIKDITPPVAVSVAWGLTKVATGTVGLFGGAAAGAATGFVTGAYNAPGFLPKISGALGGLFTGGASGTKEGINLGVKLANGLFGNKLPVALAHLGSEVYSDMAMAALKILVTIVKNPLTVFSEITTLEIPESVKEAYNKLPSDSPLKNFVSVISDVDAWKDDMVDPMYKVAESMIKNPMEIGKGMMEIISYIKETVPEIAKGGYDSLTSKASTAYDSLASKASTAYDSLPSKASIASSLDKMLFEYLDSKALTIDNIHNIINKNDASTIKGIQDTLKQDCYLESSAKLAIVNTGTDGKTALELAVEKVNLDVVKYLLDTVNDVNYINIQNDGGNSILDVVVQGLLNDPTNKDNYLKMIDAIMDKSTNESKVDHIHAKEIIEASTLPQNDKDDLIDHLVHPEHHTDGS
jgi:hypothetical protein